MTHGLGPNASHPNLSEVVRRNDAHQGTRNLGVVGIGIAAKRLPRVGILIACNPFPQAKLERIHVRIRVVRHVTDSRIASAATNPQLAASSMRIAPVLVPGPGHRHWH